MTRKLLLIGCHDTDVNAVRSLLGLLAAYLREPWRVVLEGEYDLGIVRLTDAETRLAPAPPGSPPLIPCMMHPRRHPGTALNHPFRAADLLTTLNEFSDRLGTRRAAMASVASGRIGDDAVLELSHWPVDFLQWSPEHRRIAAALARGAQPVASLAPYAGVSKTQVVSFARLGGEGGFVIAHLRASGEGSSLRPSTTARVATLYTSFVARVRERLGLA